MEELEKLQQEAESLKVIDTKSLDINQLTQVLEKLTQVLEKSEQTFINSFDDKLENDEQTNNTSND